MTTATLVKAPTKPTLSCCESEPKAPPGYIVTAISQCPYCFARAPKINKED
jgi:hypothetical protein